MFFRVGRVSWRLTGAILAGLVSWVFLMSPAQANTEYLGGGYIVIERGCNAYGWSGTQQVMVRAQPQGLEGNDANQTQLALLLGTGTMAFRLNMNRGFRFTYTPTQAVYIWNGPYAPADPTMSFLFNPDSDWLLSGDQEIQRLNAIIYNFNEHPGCQARLFASLARR